MTHGSKKTRVVVAFGDISGFTAFYDRVTSDQRELIPFLNAFDDIIDEAEKRTGYIFSDTGDGFMCIADADEGHDAVARVVSEMIDLTERITNLIVTKIPPRPDGFRVRIACGFVILKVRKTGRRVYRGKHLNLTHKLLRVLHPRPLICHSSVRELITDEQAEKYGLKFMKLKTTTPMWLRFGNLWAVGRQA